jgi:hypothetical protein
LFDGADDKQSFVDGDAVAQYHLLTIWRIEAPLVKVYAAIHDSQRWPDWWPSVQEVKQEASGDADGINSIWRYSWQGHLPYRVVFEVRPTRIEKLVAIEGIARGDLEGIGRWYFSRQGAVSVVRYEWHVRSTLWWMNLIAPFARSMFIRNHALVMTQGGEGLARLLESPLLSQENIDLMAATILPKTTIWRRQESGRIDPVIVLIAGLGAGVVATVAQFVLWWLVELPLLETFFRDVRLTAALVMGTSVLPPPSALQWEILLVATLIHFALSVTYALILAYLLGRLRTAPTLFAGALYGLVIYVLNLYGLTLLFPWFTISRDWVTLLAHLAFGVALAGGYRLFSR